MTIDAIKAQLQREFPNRTVMFSLDVWQHAETPPTGTHRNVVKLSLWDDALRVIVEGDSFNDCVDELRRAIQDKEGTPRPVDMAHLEIP